jgi:hypothetical protein
MLFRETDLIGVLDEIPGWIGEAVDETERIGRLELGGKAPLRRQRLYGSYPGDIEKYR